MEIAVGSVVQIAERHKQQLAKHKEIIRRVGGPVQRQVEALERLQKEIQALRGAQSEAAVQAVPVEMAMPVDAPIPKAPRTGGTWDRQPSPTTLQANAWGFRRP